jgi:predicted dienelactone hydrolase
VVAMPRLPDPRSLSARDAPREIWLRPADLSATLTAVEKDALLAGRIDRSRVGVLGFFLGGSAALALAGGELDAQSYARSCDQAGTGLDCAWYAKEGVDLHTVDAAQLAGSHRDERIGVAVLVDPEMSGSFTAASLAGISIPIEIINLGAADAIPPGLSAPSLARGIPDAHYETLPDASQFSAFSECKPQAAAILRSDGEEEALCQDGGGRSRAEIHARLAAMIEAAFRARWQSGL